MVFMKDTERAADLAVRESLETGLHINLAVPYDGPGISERQKMDQSLAVGFFGRGPWTQVAYNPFIAKAVVAAFNAQLEEYRRLFKRDPIYFNGHKHFHLSSNMIFSGVLPNGSSVRRSFTFYRGEKSLLNIYYRRIIDAWLLARHVSTDAFFSLDPVSDLARLARIIGLAKETCVELMVHPWKPDQFAFLIGDRASMMINSARLGDFATLRFKGEDRQDTASQSLPPSWPDDR